MHPESASEIICMENYQEDKRIWYEWLQSSQVVAVLSCCHIKKKIPTIWHETDHVMKSNKFLHAPSEGYCADIVFRQLEKSLGCSLQTALSMGFSRQGYGNGLLFPSPGDLSDPCLLLLLHWQADSLPLSHQGSPWKTTYAWILKYSTQDGHFIELVWKAYHTFPFSILWVFIEYLI